uniref:Uncharacterized protein n=1 Tax=Labrus bergylta TaxID=56723 RepID=A0A3Q3MF64_9LABR
LPHLTEALIFTCTGILSYKPFAHLYYKLNLFVHTLCCKDSFMIMYFHCPHKDIFYSRCILCHWNLNTMKQNKVNFFFASQSLYWYVDMGPVQHFKITSLLHQNKSETALNVKTLSVNSPYFHTIVTFKQPQDELMFQTPLNKLISQS